MSQPVTIQRRPFKKIAVTTLVIGWMVFLALVFSSPLKNGLIPQAMETTGDRSCAAPTNAEC